ncbi:hypothetical protein Ciccas_014627, partial [Cichlidogyrus casuarinus]
MNSAMASISSQLISLGHRLGIGPDLPSEQVIETDLDLDQEPNQESAKLVETFDEQAFWLTHTAQLVPEPAVENQSNLSGIPAQDKSTEMDAQFLHFAGAGHQDKVVSRIDSDQWFIDRQEDLNILSSRLQERRRRMEPLIQASTQRLTNCDTSSSAMHRLRFKTMQLEHMLVLAQDTISRRQDKLIALRKCYSQLFDALCTNLLEKNKTNTEGLSVQLRHIRRLPKA